MYLRRLFCLSICIAWLLGMLASSAASDSIRNRIRQATSGFKDITLTGKVLQANQAELAKIGKDFPKSYEFETTTIRYKAPDKLRVEGRLGLVNVAMVINGNRKSYSVPSLRISKSEDIKDKPHKRQTDIDMGIITDMLWRDYIVTNTATEQGASGPVYRIAFVRSNARHKNHVAWVDANTLRLLKVDKYEGGGRLKSRFLYQRHVRVNGIWVPQRIEVYNQDNKLAGVTAYENIKVNTGIPDSVFKL